MDNFKTKDQSKINLVGDAKIMSDAVDVEQERLRLIDEVRELKAALEDFEMKATAWDYCSRIIKETTDASGITELTLNYRALEYNSGAIQKAKAWDDLEALVIECDKQYREISIENDRLELSGSANGEPVSVNLKEKTLVNAVSNALENIRNKDNA